METSTTNPFERLPRDIVIFIMSKLPNDLKFLTQCSLVSHIFASSILQVPHVKLTLPSLPYPLPQASGKNNVLVELRSQLKSTFINTTTLLTEFLDLRSLHLVFSKHDYDINEDQLDGFMSHLKMKSQSITTENISYSNFMYSYAMSLWYGDSDSGSNFKSLSKLNIWTEVCLWHDLLLMAIKDFPMLQSVTISKPNLSVCISDEQLLEFKKLENMGNERENMMRMRKYLKEKQVFLD